MDFKKEELCFQGYDVSDDGIKSSDGVNVAVPVPSTQERKDTLSVRERSALMSRIRGKNTGPELLLFRLLRQRKVYFARHVTSLPGKPDVVFRRCRLAVFVDGEFWHGRNFDDWKGGLSSFWRTKIEKNIARDRNVDVELGALGWTVIRLWGKELQRNPEECVRNILRVRTERLSATTMKAST